MRQAIVFAFVMTTALLATPAAAALSYSCSFTLECVDAEPCQDTAFELDATMHDGFQTGTLSSISGDIDTTLTNSQGLSFFTGYASATMHLLSLSGSNARYSVHTSPALAQVMAITYHGTCQETE